MYERCKSEVDVGGNWRASYVRDGDVVILEIFQRGARTRGGLRVMVVSANNGVLGDHPVRLWRGNGMGL